MTILKLAAEFYINLSGTDCVAAEAHHHRKEYEDYTRKTYKEQKRLVKVYDSMACFCVSSTHYYLLLLPVTIYWIKCYDFFNIAIIQAPNLSAYKLTFTHAYVIW